MQQISNAGRDLLAQKQGAGQPFICDRFVLANVPGQDHTAAIDPATMALPPAEQIVWQGAVTASGYVTPDQVVYSLLLGSDIGPFDFNWVGLIGDDGTPEGTLVAVTTVPLQSKTKTVGSVSGNNLTRNFLLAFTDAAAATNITVQAQTWQVDFTARFEALEQWQAEHSHADFLRKDASGVIDAGESTTLTIKCDDTGTAELAVHGDIQGTGRLYVGQSAKFGGGLEYNGDNTPVSTGAGADHIALFRRDSSGEHWTMRNDYAGNIWEFRETPTVGEHQIWHAGNHNDTGEPHPQYQSRREFVGAVVGFQSATAPPGWIKCNGSALDRNAFADLWAYAQASDNLVEQALKDANPELYQNAFGTGDGATTFTLGDLRGEFPRGWDDGRGIDAGRLLGSNQAADISAHAHFVVNTSTVDGGGLTSGAHIAEHGGNRGNNHGYDLTGNGTEPSKGPTSMTGGNETRPRNVALLFCIKY